MFRSDDVVTTRDGYTHRVIYQSGDQLFVKTAEDGKKRKVKISSIIEHKPKGK